jgi:hypothetical protein
LAAGCGGGHALRPNGGERGDATAEVAADVPAEMGDDVPSPPPEVIDAAAADADGDAGGDALGPVCDAGADGGAWQILGAPLSSTSDNLAWVPALALAEQDRPVVAWLEGKSAGQSVFTAAWNEEGCDGQWEALGAKVDDGAPPCLAFGAAGLMRAYMKPAESQVVVERWDGSAFLRLGDPLIGSILTADWVTAPTMVADAAGDPIIAWGRAAAMPAGVWASRWSGGVWQPLSDETGIEGSFVISTYQQTPVSLALDRDGTPLVAWEGFGRKVSVARFGGSMMWNVVGTRFGDQSQNFEFSGPVVRVNATGVLFATKLVGTATDVHPNVFRFDGVDWQALGDPPHTEGSGQDYDFALDGTGAPVLAVAEQRTGSSLTTIYLYRWSGTAWEKPVPPPPVSPTLTVRSPRLMIDGLGRVVLAWAEGVQNRGAIHVVRTVR